MEEEERWEYERELYTGGWKGFRAYPDDDNDVYFASICCTALSTVALELEVVFAFLAFLC